MRQSPSARPPAFSTRIASGPSYASTAPLGPTPPMLKPADCASDDVDGRLAGDPELYSGEGTAGTASSRLLA